MCIKIDLKKHKTYNWNQILLKKCFSWAFYMFKWHHASWLFHPGGLRGKKLFFALREKHRAHPQWKAFWLQVTPPLKTTTATGTLLKAHSTQSSVWCSPESEKGAELGGGVSKTPTGEEDGCHWSLALFSGGGLLEGVGADVLAADSLSSCFTVSAGASGSFFTSTATQTKHFRHLRTFVLMWNKDLGSYLEWVCLQASAEKRCKKTI